MINFTRDVIFYIKSYSTPSAVGSVFSKKFEAVNINQVWVRNVPSLLYGNYFN